MTVSIFICDVEFFFYMIRDDYKKPLSNELGCVRMFCFGIFKLNSFFLGTVYAVNLAQKDLL